MFNKLVEIKKGHQLNDVPSSLTAIIKAQPKRVVYVSCNPATLARDARFLNDNGYTITATTAFDLFPHTSHVETVCLMSK